MNGLSPTRAEMLVRRARISHASQGRDLLRDKRASLLRELSRVAERASVMSAALAECSREGRRALADTNALDGPEPLRSAALAAAGELELTLHTRNVAGVRVVEVESAGAIREPTARGYSMSASDACIDQVAYAYEQLLDQLLKVAATELTLRRLAVEIRAVTRRVNALERVVLPRLERERDAIALALEEREREDRVRLRRAKMAISGPVAV